MRLKIALVGPSESGKTTIANILGQGDENEGNSDNTGLRNPYYPTNVRIIDYQGSIELRKYSIDVDVQIWEVGGNPKLKGIWPGIQNGMDGIILAYDSTNEVHMRETSAYHMHFVTHSHLAGSPQQILLIGNVFRGQRQLNNQKIVGVSHKVRQFLVNIEEDPRKLKEEFKSFLTNVTQIAVDKEKNTFSE